MRSKRLVAVLGLVSMCVQAQDTVTYVGRFDASNSSPPAPWQIVRFDERIPPTKYRVISWDGVAAVEAEAHASMALLARPLNVDLKSTPVLCWRWRVDAPLKTADMATKQGDDYAARVYVAFRMPPESMSFTTRSKISLARTLYGARVPDAALNYVWENRYPVGTRRANAYTDRTQMIVVRSGPDDAGHWVSERRDVLVDIQKAFGNANASPLSFAIASDTDNTGETARAGFANLHFVSRNSACAIAPR